MMKHSKIILHPLFLVSLVLLLFNDLYLKLHFHNFFTGKLSDVAGLLVLSQLLIAFVGNRYQIQIYLWIALGFGFWKSPLSQNMIDGWSLHFYPIERTIDPTDLFCLLVFLPLYRFPLNCSNIRFQFHFLKIPVLAFTFFAIMATSSVRFLNTNKIYIVETLKVDSKIPEFLNKLNEDQIEYKMDSFFVFKKDTFQRFVLKNFIINHEKINSMEIGLKEKKNKSKLFIYTLEVDSMPYSFQNSYVKDIKLIKKRYKISLDNYFSK